MNTIASGRARFHGLAGLRPREILLCLAAVPVGLLMAYELVHGGLKLPLAIVVVPALAWSVVSRRTAGMLLGAALILTVPYWDTLGPAQLGVARVASLLALVTFLYARRLHLCSVDLLLAAFIAVVVLGWALQYDQPGAGRVMTVEMQTIGFYFGARAFPPDRRPQLLLVILLAGTVGALTVLYEYVHGSAVFIDPSTYLWNASDESIFRPGGVFGNPPGAATVLTVVIIFGVALVYLVEGRVRILAGVCLGICSLALISTFTRTAFIAIAIGIFVLLWFMRSPITRRLWRMAWLAGVAGVVIFAALPVLQKSTTFQNGVLRSGLGQSTLTVRESYWALALPIATRDVHNFLFGIGTSSLETPSISNHAVVLPDMARAPQVYVNSLHNQYVTTLVEQGVIGLALLVLVLFSAAARTTPTALRARDPVAAAVVASILAVAVMMLADTVLLHGPSFAMLMLALGLGASTPSSGHWRLRRWLARG